MTDKNIKCKAIKNLLISKKNKGRDSRGLLITSIFARIFNWLKRNPRNLYSRHKINRAKKNFQLHGIESVVLDLPGLDGRFEVSIESAIFAMIIAGGYEKELEQYWEIGLTEGDHVIDIGANIGLFSVLASKSVGKSGRVLAVEPNPQVINLLKANLYRNKVENADLYEGVVTEKPGEQLLHAVIKSPEYSSLGKVTHPNAPPGVEEILVNGDTLDYLVEKYNILPDFIKIDAEGAEGLIFMGGEKVLAKMRPLVLCELDDRLLKNLGWHSNKIIRLLEQNNYLVFDAYKGDRLIGPLEYFCGEIIALPGECCDE